MLPDGLGETRFFEERGSLLGGGQERGSLVGGGRRWSNGRRRLSYNSSSFETKVNLPEEKGDEKLKKNLDLSGSTNMYQNICFWNFHSI